jgi:3-oxoacyl-[acyl-carrier-protein] synthase II
VTQALARMWTNLAPRIVAGQVAVISGASGAEPATSEERAWLDTLPGVPVRATGTHIGHGIEPQFAMNIALATIALGHEKLSVAAQPGPEAPMESGLKQAIVTAVGHWRGEGMALVEAAR